MDKSALVTGVRLIKGFRLLLSPTVNEGEVSSHGSREKTHENAPLFRLVRCNVEINLVLTQFTEKNAGVENEISFITQFTLRNKHQWFETKFIKQL